MWLLVFLFLVTTLLLAWTMFGYFLFAWIIGLFRPKKAPVFPPVWPVMSVIVPCYNEEGAILEKLENLRALDYPKDKLEAVFVDGRSTDGTVRLLTENIRGDEPYRVHTCARGGKIHQLNEIIPRLKGEIIVNTDVDAHLRPDTLKWVAAEFNTAPDVYVVGVYISPASSMEVELYYWDSQNKVRLLESDAGAASIVIAPCYAFKKGLLTAFPDDVVADDVYVATLANSLGYRAVYSRAATARETRMPESYAEFLPHKFRKSNAVLRESLRFLYKLPEMGYLVKIMSLTRVIQQLLLPWTLLWWLLLAGALMTIFPVVRYDIVLFCAGFLLALLLITGRVFASVKLPDTEEVRVYSSRTIMEGYIVTLFILLMTGVSYLFFRQGSSYARLENANTDTRGRTGPSASHGAES